MLKSVLFLLVCGLSQTLIAQNNVDNESVEIDIKFEYHYNQVFLTATKGCNWLQLQFNFFPHEDAKLVDNIGVATYSDELYENIKDDRSFLFTIERTQTGFKVKGLKGFRFESV